MTAMPPLLLIGAGVAAYLWFKNRNNPIRQLPAGISTEPMKALPPDVKAADAHPAQAQTVNGRQYATTTWPIVGGRQFAFTQMAGSPAWVSYYHTNATKERKLYRAYDPNDSGATVSLIMQVQGVKR